MQHSTASDDRPVLIDRPAEGVALIQLNRPSRLNALNAESVATLLGALDTVAADPTCRVVILTGAGRGFCAGLDMAGYGVPAGVEDSRPLQRNYAIQQQLAAVVTRLRNLHVPVIAAVNGAAAGGGFALALAADVRIASTAASFTVAFIKVGLSACEMGVSWLLPRAIGSGLAFELLLTGRTVAADEAERIGLVNRVVPDVELLPAALRTAALIVANSPWGVRMTKEVMWSQLEIGSLQAGIDLENRTQLLSTYTGDVAEAMAAFQAKRPPRWS